MVLMFVGGGIGGVVGVLAVGVSHKLMMGAKSVPERYALGLAVLVGSVVLWVAAAMLLMTVFPSLRR